MKISLLISAGALALAVSSCTTIQQTSSSESIDTHICNLTVADMKVSGDKAEKTVNWAWNPLTTFSLAEQKKSATAELLRDSEADVLVEPQYIVSRRGIFRGGSVTVSGYPATYSNFRNMTKEELELAVGADRCTAGETEIVAVNPVVQTSASYRFDDSREPNERPLSRQFVSITYGGVYVTGDDEEDSNYTLGLMYGSYGQSWGWYGRVSLAFADSEYREGRYSDYGSKTLCVPNFTIGFIKTMNKNFNFLMGIGLGGAFKWNSSYWDYYNDYDYERVYDLKRRFSVPVECGFQYRTHRLNVLAGLTVGISDNGNIMPFMGIGYSF